MFSPYGQTIKVVKIAVLRIQTIFVQTRIRLFKSYGSGSGSSIAQINFVQTCLKKKIFGPKVAFNPVLEWKLTKYLYFYVSIVLFSTKKVNNMFQIRSHNSG
jgi:hypothetical protein